jgi:hypothetical protein
VPMVESPPTVPFTSQDTCEFEGLIVAVNCCVAEVRTEAVVGAMAIEAGNGGRGGGFPPPAFAPPQERNSEADKRIATKKEFEILFRSDPQPRPMIRPIAPIQSARAPKLAVDARPDGLDCSVAMLKVTVVAPAPATNAGGLKAHDACGGKFKHEKVTGC